MLRKLHLTVLKKIKTLLGESYIKQSEPIEAVKVSVIIPVYKVEEYLPSCLESILEQSHYNIEVVCVDDGSPDNSIEVLHTYAAKDRRVKVVRKANGGLGAARNTGVENSTGGMICFVDSDDTLPPSAIEHLLTSLVRSGSDFAVGSLMRDTSTGRHTPNWAQKLHATTRTHLTVIDEPEVLKNVFAWTKMFRRQFFLDVIGGFPDGLYEDQVPSAKAYIYGTFDIIKHVVYYWRIRDDETSITQQKATMKDLVGRWEVIDSLAEQMTGAPAPVLRAWQAKAVGFDMRPYYEQIPRTNDEYWEYLQSSVCSFLDSVGYEVLADVPVSDRLLTAATYHGYRDDVTELLCRRETQTWKVPGIVVDGTARVAPEYFEDLHLCPDGVLEVLSAPGDVSLTQHVNFVRITDDELVIRGSAHLTNLSQSFENSAITLVASQAGPVHDVSDSVYEVRPVRVNRHSEPDADRRAADPWNDHAKSGFQAVFSLAALHKGNWDLSITLDISGVSRTAPLEAPDIASAGRFPAFGAVGDQGRWYLAHTRQTGGLQLRHVTLSQLAVDEVCTEDGFLNVRLARNLHSGKGSFVATSGSSRVVGSLSVRDEQEVVSFRIPSTSRYRKKWSLWWQSGKRREQLAWADSRQAVSTNRVQPFVVRASAVGNVVVLTGPLVGEITGAALTKSGLEVTGWLQRNTTLDATLIRAKLHSQFVPGSSVPIDISNGNFTVTLPLTDTSGSPLSRARGYAVVLETKGGELTWPQVTEEVLASLPLEAEHRGIGMMLTATPRARALWVRLRNAFTEGERSRRSQHLLQKTYRDEHRPMDAVMFESFNGKGVGDSPLALSRELQRRGSGMKQYWSVESLTTPVPEWATPLLRYSKPWYEILASARLLINNNNWPWFFTKRPHQTYLQTWHGTPLKQIGNDMPGSNLTLTYRALMAREANVWDYLIAQNDYSAKIFSRAFGYDGDIIQLGYPRNDALVGNAAQAIRERTRAALGLEKHVRVLLYAPTWRDNLKDRSGYGRVSFLDFDILHANVEKDTLVLYRGHSNTASASGGLPEDVLDVTRYPDVNELMLASDALVTDYSSIFFDYAVMRKPIYFLVPDIEQYSSATRGFYMPLEEVAPGPLCMDTESLARELNQDFHAIYGKRFDNFIDTYAPRDDGFAAARVLDTFEISCKALESI